VLTLMSSQVREYFTTTYFTSKTGSPRQLKRMNEQIPGPGEIDGVVFQTDFRLISDFGKKYSASYVVQSKDRPSTRVDAVLDMGMLYIYRSTTEAS
jgi:hypothetical protein